MLFYVASVCVNQQEQVVILQVMTGGCVVAAVAATSSVGVQRWLGVDVRL